jgi:hypothetical protein
MHSDADWRRSGPQTHFHELRGAGKPHDANGHAPVHTPDACVLEKLENHAAMGSLYFMYDNFGRMHQTLRVTPAMEAGLADHVWTIEEIVALIG